MAIITKTIGILAWEGFNDTLLQYDYDDGNLQVQAVRVINNGPRTLIVVAEKPDLSKSYTLTAPSGQTTTQNIPPGAANRLQLVVDSQGRLDGVQYSTHWAEA